MVFLPKVRVYSIDSESVVTGGMFLGLLWKMKQVVPLMHLFVKLYLLHARGEEEIDTPL